MKAVAWLGLLAAVVVTKADDTQAGLLRAVTDAGFGACKSAVKEDFNDYFTTTGVSGSIEIIVQGRKTFQVIAAWGTSGDTAQQQVVFEQAGDRCAAYSSVQISFGQSCMKYLGANPAWKPREVVGDIVWTKADGGKRALARGLPGGGCSITYFTSRSYHMDKVK